MSPCTRRSRSAALCVLVVCVASLAGARADDPRILLEVGRDFPETRLFSVCPVRCSADTPPFLAVAGFTNNGRVDLADLAVYELNGSDTALRWRLLRGGPVASSIRTLRAADLDADGCDELIALGRIGNEDVDSRAELQVFRYSDDQWHLLASERWQSGTYTHGYGMSSDDLDGDGRPEIVTGGFFATDNHEQAELRIWRLTYGQLTLIASTAWGSETGQTRINAVCIGDVSGDGHPEVVTAGRTGQVQPEQHVTMQEADQLVIWRLRDSQLERHAVYEGDPASRSRFRELKLVDIDAQPGLELLAVGRQDPQPARGRGDGTGGGRGDGSGGGRGDGTGGGRNRARTPGVTRPLFSVFKLQETELTHITDANFGTAAGEVRDVAVMQVQDGAPQFATITADDLQPQRNAALDLWEWRDSSLHLLTRRTADLGDETRARQLLLWGPPDDQRLLTIGFVKRNEQILGQILDWGAVPASPAQP